LNNRKPDTMRPNGYCQRLCHNRENILVLILGKLQELTMKLLEKEEKEVEVKYTTLIIILTTC